MVKAPDAINEPAKTANTYTTTKAGSEQKYIAYDYNGRKFKPSFVKQCLEAEERCKRGEGTVYTYEQHLAEIKRLEALVRSQSRKTIKKARAKSATTR